MGGQGKNFGPETTKQYSTEKEVVQAEKMKGNEGYEGNQQINQGKIIKCRDRRKGCKEEL